MKKEIKEIIKSILFEGQIERNKASVEQIVEKLKDRVLIFFDTETTGLNPRSSSALIIEIAAVAYDTSTGERLGQYSMKSKLSQAVLNTMAKQQKAEDEGRPKPHARFLAIRDILKMTGYHEGDIPYDEEDRVLKGYSEFIAGFAPRRPILVAHNAKFDMYQIGKALERHNLPKIQRFPVLDTMALVGNYIHPIISMLESTKDQDPEIDRLLRELKQNGKYVKTLSNLGKAFNVSTSQWHSAIADAEQLSGITSALIKFLENRKHVDVKAGRDKIKREKPKRNAK